MEILTARRVISPGDGDDDGVGFERILMKITRVEIREIRMPLVRFFETSFGRTTERRIVLVRVEADGFTGWGEVTCGEHPFYSDETPATAWHILREYLVPWCLGRNWAAASEAATCFRPIRGHNMAKAALENALWDIEAQQKGMPLAKLIGGTQPEIPAGFPLASRTRWKNYSREFKPNARLVISGSN